MTGLRWALARLFAPERIIRDPFPQEEGVFVYYRSEPGLPIGWSWVIKAERFRMKSTSNLASLDYGADDFAYHPRKPFTRFVGTVGGAR